MIVYAFLVTAILGVILIWGPYCLSGILEVLVNITSVAMLLCVVTIIMLALTSIINQIAYSKHFYDKFNKKIVKVFRVIVSKVLIVEYIIAFILVLTIILKEYLINASKDWNFFMKEQTAIMNNLNNIGLFCEILAGGMLLGCFLSRKKDE